MKTVIDKSYYGWKAETAVDVGNDAEIHIVTMKRSSGAIITTAIRGKVKDDMFTYMPFSDFNKTYKVSNDRCTEKNVKLQHESVLADIEAIKADCVSFYQSREK